MATIFELTGSEREQRITELKQKMLAAYAVNKAAHEAGGAATHAAPVAVAVAEEEEAPVAVMVADTMHETVATPTGNGAVVAAPKPVAVPKAPPRPAAPKPAKAEEVVPALSSADMTRREFMTYAWGATLGLLTLETGLVSYFFMYPRFRAGEFGGKFFLKETDIPAPDVAPVGYSAGKFWFVSTPEGPKAIYMVCTHLGCLYKWAPSNNRFECPCHGSKFSHDGFYIEGPAPRSLDSFTLTIENGQVSVDTGKKITGNPSSESPARVVKV